jgi:hypothetical protein
MLFAARAVPEKEKKKIVSLKYEPNTTIAIQTP